MSKTLIIGLFLFWRSLAFCQSIPAIHINTENDIVDEPKVDATLTFIDEKGNSKEYIIGIEIRGGFSQSFPKKTYDIEFWQDESGNENIDVQFGDLRNDDDWVLDALYNEPLRLNSFLSHKLWLDMQQPYYQEEEPNAKSGADVMYVTVTLNDIYQGIYMLSEQVDRSLLKLKKPIDDSFRGELYKATNNEDASFYNYPNNAPSNSNDYWSGFNFIYPKLPIDWSNLETFISFVGDSSDEEFEASIDQKIVFDNVIDYFILINVSRALDNRGKNIYLCRYDMDEPYFFAPWDLDGSWGLLWDGSNASKTEDILTNNLYDRLLEINPNEFKKRLIDRWTFLRGTLLDEDNLCTRIDGYYSFLKENNIYELEENRWEDYSENFDDLSYMKNWISERIQYLDEYFQVLSPVFDEVSDITVYPNPSDNFLTIDRKTNKISFALISDLNGNILLGQKLQLDKENIDLRSFNAGIYILKIDNYVTKFTKL